MMGVYIPNIEMPNNCYDCKVEREANCHIWQGIDSASNYTDRRYGLCPLIEIVYCKDCIHSRMGEYSGELECTYAFHQMCDDDNCYTWLEVSPNDFCSYGKKRTETLDERIKRGLKEMRPNLEWVEKRRSE